MKKENNNSNYKISKKGFTIVEALVAISILLIGLTGPLSAAVNGVNQTQFARDQIIAFYLAQDAIEYIKNVRDNNNLGGSDWLAGDINRCIDQNCVVDVWQSSATCAGNPCYIKISSLGQYGYNSAWTDTKFTRTVRITKGKDLSGNNLTDEAEIAVDISWKTGSLTKTFTARELMFNWKKSAITI